MRNWMFIISIFLLVACDEVAYLRNDEKPVLVLNAVLEAGCDSMRIELTETKGAYDQSPWQRFPFLCLAAAGEGRENILDRSPGGRERNGMGGDASASKS